MGKKLEVPTGALQGATARAKERAQKTMKQAQGKPNGDFIRLDLRPAGYDLKAYCVKRSGEISAKTGKPCSTTAFLQRLIIEDMGRKSGKTADEEFMEKIRELKPEHKKIIDDMVDALLSK